MDLPTEIWRSILEWVAGETAVEKALVLLLGLLAPLVWAHIRLSRRHGELKAEISRIVPHVEEGKKTTPPEKLVSAVLPILGRLRSFDEKLKAAETSGIWALPSTARPLFSPTKTRYVTVANLKGGVGKTTVTANLAGTLARHGYQVLVIDLDWQQSLTRLCLTDSQIEASGVFRPMHKTALVSALEEFPKEAAPDCWQPIRCQRNGSSFDVLPTTLGLGFAEDTTVVRWLANANGPDCRFTVGSFIRQHSGKYDIVLMDGAPRFTVSLTGALAISDLVLLPVTPDRLSFGGAEFFFSLAMQKVRSVLWKDLATEQFRFPRFGIVANRCAAGASGPEIACSQVRRLVNDLRATVSGNGTHVEIHASGTAFKNLVCYATAAEGTGTEVRLAVDLHDAVADDYMALTEEVLGWLGLPPPAPLAVMASRIPTPVSNAHEIG
jgi:cellulose biosynthesis protein BcsQ